MHLVVIRSGERALLLDERRRILCGVDNIGGRLRLHRLRWPPPGRPLRPSLADTGGPPGPREAEDTIPPAKKRSFLL